MDSQTYRPAPMSTGLAVMSGVFVAVAVIGLAAVPLLIGRGQGVMVLIVAFLWLIILICWQARPRCYELREDCIAVIRGWPYRNVIIPLADIKDVRIARLRWAWKTCGIDFPFSMSGWFRSKELGKFFASVTDADKVVLLSNGRKYAISPKYPDEFAADLKRIIRQV